LKPMVLGIPCFKKPQLGLLGETNTFDSSITIAQNNANVFGRLIEFSLTS
jgi:hypothetical protein